MSTRLETCRPCGPGSWKSIISATQHTLALGRTFQVSDWLLLLLPHCEKITRCGPSSWVQILLTKATISRLSFLLKASSPQSITLETRISFLLDTEFPLCHSGWLQAGRSFCVSLSRQQPECSRDSVASHCCLWQPEFFPEPSGQVGEAQNFDYPAENFGMSQSEVELVFIKKRF